MTNINQNVMILGGGRLFISESVNQNAVFIGDVNEAILSGGSPRHGTFRSRTVDGTLHASQTPTTHSIEEGG